MLVGVNLFVILSKYAEQIPLLMFGIVQSILPHFFIAFGVHISAGRRRLRTSQSKAFLSGLASVMARTLWCKQTAVIPIETAPTTAPC